jgi:hypothetical protein
MLHALVLVDSPEIKNYEAPQICVQSVLRQARATESLQYGRSKARDGESNGRGHKQIKWSPSEGTSGKRVFSSGWCWVSVPVASRD